MSLTIAVGSKRPPKVAAVKAAVGRIRKHLLPQGGGIRFCPHEVGSGVPGMPRSGQELMRGAANRVRELVRLLRERGEVADFFVGLEGGFYRVRVDDQELSFLQGWVFVSDGRQGYYGATGSIAVPQRIAALVYEQGKELGDIIDDFAFDSDIRNKQGAFGVFSRNVLNRRQSFEFAVISAFAPFFNSSLYVR